MVTGVELQKYGLRNSTELQKQPVILHWGKWSESQDGVSIIIVFLMAWYIVHAQFGTQCNVIIMKEGGTPTSWDHAGGSGSRMPNLFQKERQRDYISSPLLRNISLCYWRMFSMRGLPLTHVHHKSEHRHTYTTRCWWCKTKHNLLPSGVASNKSHTHTDIYTSSSNSLCSHSTGLRPCVLMWAKWFPHFIQGIFPFFFLVFQCCFVSGCDGGLSYRDQSVRFNVICKQDNASGF